MPAKSKQQQKFMGLVHAFKKGEVPASKVSQAVKDAAKSMTKKSVKKYAKTKHDDLPKKVSEKVNPEIKKIYQLLIKYGNSAKDATAMIKKNLKYVNKTYRNSTPRGKAIALVGLQSLGESVNEGQKRMASTILNKFDQAYIKFSREIRDVIKMMDRSTGSKVDGKIIDKAYSKGLIPLDKLMQEWGRGQQSNPKIDEKIKLKSKSGMGTISHVGMPKASKGVEKLFKIADSGYGKVGGVTVDSMSANLFKQIYNKANDDIKKKLNTKNEKQLVKILGGMWKKFGKNVSIGSSL